MRDTQKFGKRPMSKWKPNKNNEYKILGEKKQSVDCFLFEYFYMEISLDQLSLVLHPFLDMKSTWFCISTYSPTKWQGIRKYQYK